MYTKKWVHNENALMKYSNTTVTLILHYKKILIQKSLSRQLNDSQSIR